MFWLFVKIQIIAHSSCSFRPHDVCLHYLMLKVYSLHKNRVGNIVSCLILYKNLSWILYSYSLAFVIYTAFKYTTRRGTTKIYYTYQKRVTIFLPICALTHAVFYAHAVEILNTSYYIYWDVRNKIREKDTLDCVLRYNKILWLSFT